MLSDAGLAFCPDLGPQFLQNLSRQPDLCEWHMLVILHPSFAISSSPLRKGILQPSSKVESWRLPFIGINGDCIWSPLGDLDMALVLNWSDGYVPLQDAARDLGNELPFAVPDGVMMFSMLGCR
ncbi:hypothetical protein GUJ93_ZPchr0012g21848 [Zizania palustris]|uniref:Uncharacterized protein n=1 Tax=Zizania palustris TaxID=103762 RepID=A0A8J5WMG5_ZIZPA|nr:hypothetical protein GUJ93_ZPchr0012g21848 [Zizania palustris]